MDRQTDRHRMQQEWKGKKNNKEQGSGEIRGKDKEEGKRERGILID